MNQRLPVGRFYLLLSCSLLVAPAFPAALQAGVVAWGDGSSGQTNVPAGLADTVAVAAGRGHTLALSREGGVVAWGDNSAGQTNVPGGLGSVAGIGAGAYQSLAVRRDGTVAAWGNGQAGQVPADLTNAAVAAAGYPHNLAIRTNGTLAAWGDNSVGQRNVPPGATNIVAIALGNSHDLALRADGQVFAWGDNSGGQCNVPGGLAEVVAIAAGYRHSLALKRDGSLVAWGDNSYGQCNVPGELSDVTAIAAGNLGNLALKRNGTVTGWGDNSYGQTFAPSGLTGVVAVAAGVAGNFSLALVGEGLPVITAQPLSLTTYSGWPMLFRANAAGAAPLAFQWRFNGGDIPGETNSFLWLGNAQSSNAGSYSVAVSNSLSTATSVVARLTVTDSGPSALSAPTNMTAYPGQAVSFQISAVGSGPLRYQWFYNGVAVAGATSSSLGFSAAPDSGGQYAVVVMNVFGAITNSAALAVPLGVGWPSDHGGLPVFFAPASVTDLVAIATGVPLTVINDTGIRRDGSVLNWNSSGASVGGLPAGLSNMEAITMGRAHWLGLRTDGTVTAWGDNSFGQGVAPSNLTNVVAIAAGLYMNMALRADGTIALWGGNGPTNMPVGITNAIAMAAGYNHALVAREDGTVIAWGDNTHGQTNVPAGLSNVVDVVAQADYSVALRRDGTVVAWPGPVNGMPVPAGLSNVIALAAGAAEAYALKNDGTVVAFGLLNQTNPPPAGLTNVAAISTCDGSPRATALAGKIAPFLTRRPMNMRVTAGADFTFHSRATGSLPLSYQWRLNGANLTGATSADLALHYLLAPATGNYSVVVTNAFGATTSAVAVLTIAPSLSQPMYGANSFSVQVLTLAGRSYVFEFKDLLTDAFWTPLLNFVGDGGSRLLTDTNAFGPQRFYRVRQLNSACQSRPANLVSWWRAESNAADAVSGVSGALAGNAGYVAGAVGVAFSFDGNNDGVQLGAPAALQLQDFTIETWVKRTDPTLATANGESGGSFLGWDTGGYGFGVYNDGRLNLTRIGVSVIATAAILVDTSFHHVAVTKTGSTVIFFLDGVAYPVAAYDPGFTFSSTLAIGSRADLSHGFWGAIDELSFYSRALSAGEIQSIYAAGSAGKCVGP